MPQNITIHLEEVRNILLMNSGLSNKRWPVIHALFYLILGYFTYLMVLITIQYIPIDFEVAFLRIKQTQITHTYYQWAFFIHVYSSIFLLIAGFTQFWKQIRIKYPVIHRNIGKAYVFIILLVSSPSGLVMAYHANGGTGAKISFSILAILWFIFTYLAFQYAIKRKWKLHQQFMMRSFALTLSAISLRLFKWIIVSTLALPPMDTYRIVAWSGWTVNLVVIESYLLLKRSSNKNS